MSTGFPGTLRTSPSIGRSNSNRNELSRCLPRLCVASAPKCLTRQTPPEAGTMRILIAGGQGQLGRAVEAVLAGHDVWAPGHSELGVRAGLERHCIVRTSWLYGAGRISFPEKILTAARERGALRLVTDEVASPTWTVDLAQAIAGLLRKKAFGVFHLTNAGSCSRKEWAEEVVRLAGEKVRVEPATQSEFGAPFRKPQFSALANVNAQRLGITMRPWQEALAEHMKAAVIQGTRS